LRHNTKPKPFVWSKSAEDIITRERRALDKLDEIRGNR
ncbi:MAG: IS630 family transposase, partial [Rhodobacteraceae bacterium]|nr:IS630 family transposase [Paracoccaceae bacterium]MBI1220437.1 IS630 family transposase [Paracoccaceae bacterium]